jgi:L-fuconolactonase
MVQDIADDDLLLSRALAPLLVAMARNRLLFDVLVLSRCLSRLLQVVDRHLDLEFVLDHSGKPRLAIGEIATWQPNIALLAAHPNIVCKLSGLVTEAAPDWQIADLLQGGGICCYALRAAAQAVGKRLAGGQSGGGLCKLVRCRRNLAG